jgi:DNA-binding transcriptional LysR family regulator
MKIFLDFYGLALFVIVARAGGLGAAERTTGIPKATLSRRLCALEASLNVRLFQRTGRGVVLTVRGEHLYSRSLEGFEMAEKAIEEVRGEASPETDCNGVSA